MRKILALVPVLFLSAPLWAYSPVVEGDCDGWSATATGVTKGVSCATITLECDNGLGGFDVVETIDVICVINDEFESFDYGSGEWTTELDPTKTYRACIEGVLWQGIFDEVPADLGPLGDPHLSGSDCSDVFGDCGEVETTFDITVNGDCDGWNANGSANKPGIACIVVTLSCLQDGVFVEVDSTGEICVLTGAGGSIDFGSGLWSLELGNTDYEVCATASFFESDATEAPADSSGLGDADAASDDCAPIFDDCAPPPPSWDPRTPGYWKNHPEVWPILSVEIGGMVYDQACLLDFFDRPTKGDVRVILIHHLISAKLNLEMGSDPESGDGMDSILGYVTDADAYLASSMVSCEDGVIAGPKPSGAAKATGEAIKDALDTYNNGLF